MNWRGVRVCITGGASFISSHLVDALVKQYASVRVIDNLSSGKREYLAEHMKTGAISFIEGDLNDSRMTREAILGRDVVFHLAADHGGRGYVDRHQADCATNLGLDGIVFKACLDAKVKQVVFASSGCIYPVHLQTNVKEELLLTEVMAGPPYNADKMYGWAKMMGELTLKAFSDDYGLKSASCRFFTCFSEDTYILTPTGVKRIADVRTGDPVYTLNPETKHVELSTVVERQNFASSNSLIRLNHEAVDFLLTDDHKLFFQDSYKGKVVETTAGEFAQSRWCRRLLRHMPIDSGKRLPLTFSLWNYLTEDMVALVKPRSKEGKKSLISSGYKWQRWNGQFSILPQEISKPHCFEALHDCDIRISWGGKNGVKSTRFSFYTPAVLDLMAWYITEGSARSAGKTEVNISQYPIHMANRKHIEATLDELGVTYRTDAKGYEFSNKLLRSFLVKECGKDSIHKRIPAFVFGLDMESRQRFFDTLMRGDGDADGGKFSTVSLCLAEDMFHLSFTLGMKASVRKDKENIYRVAFRRVAKATWIKPQHVSRENGNGRVVCLTTNKNHIVYAGRNGVFNWIGQCYGPRGKEDHAVHAMIARAFIRQDPFQVWGTGDQIRNWTYVSDIVSGLLLSAEHIHDASAVNLGTTERITVLQAAKMACACFGHQPEFQFLPKMPVGPLNRVSDNTRAFERMGWKPAVPFATGIVDTAEWYAETHERAEVEKTLESRLLAR